MGQWKRYSCVPAYPTLTQTTGTCNAADWPKVRITSDTNAGVVYRIIIGNIASTNCFYIRKSLDNKATWTNIYAAPSTTDLFFPSTIVSGAEHYASCDEGIEIDWPDDTANDQEVNDAWDFTVPSLERVYDGGIHGFVDMAYAEGISGIKYSEDIPFNLSEVSTIAINARHVNYNFNQTDVVGNAGSTTTLQWSVDGIKWINGFELGADLNYSDSDDRDQQITVYDKGDVTGTVPLETGGDSLKYRIKTHYEDLTGNEKTIAQNQFLHVAIYNHKKR